MKIFETIFFLLNKYVDNNKCHKGTHHPENHMPTKGNFVVKTNIIYFINKKLIPTYRSTMKNPSCLECQRTRQLPRLNERTANATSTQNSGLDSRPDWISWAWHWARIPSRPDTCSRNRSMMSNRSLQIGQFKSKFV